MEKEIVTTDLVSLRSGLSLISKYTDEIRKEETNKSKAFEKIDNLQLEKRKAQGNIRSLQYELEVKWKNYEKAKHKFDSFDEKALLEKELEEACIEQKVDVSAPKPQRFLFDPNVCDFSPLVFSGFYDNFADKASKWFKAAISIYIVGVALLFLFSNVNFVVIATYVIWGLTSLPVAITLLLPIVWGILFVVRFLINFILWPPIDLIRICIYNTVELPKKRKIFNETYSCLIENEKNASIKRIMDEKTVLKQDRDDAEKIWKEAKEKFEAASFNKRDFDAEIHEVNIEIQNIKNRIESHAKRSKTLVNALEDTYGVTLARSDWAHLDIILHYLMTGRADTLKEALQQLDRQKQTDQIVGAIKSAEQAIGDHIRNAISGLGQALALSFERIDRRLKVLSMDMVAVGESMNKKLDFQNQRIDSQISLQEMNTALLEKSNYTSETLLNDLRYNQRFWIK